MKVDRDALHEIQAFLDGTSPAEDLEAWLAGIDYDLIDSRDELDEQDDLAGLRLLLLEAGEGLRPLDEARVEAQRLLKTYKSVKPSF